MTDTLELMTSEVVEIENAVTIPAKPTSKRKTIKKPVVVVKKARPAYFAVPVNELGIVDQVSVAFTKHNMIATLLGFILGGMVPAFVFEVGHYEVAARPWMWAFVIGGLIYSAITVFKWGTVFFSSKVKSFGFVVLIEGVMTFSQDHYVGGAALGLLIGINGIATACNLIANRKEARKATKDGK